jgi:hypothetical protein
VRNTPLHSSLGLTFLFRSLARFLGIGSTKSELASVNFNIFLEGLFLAFVSLKGNKTVTLGFTGFVADNVGIVNFIIGKVIFQILICNGKGKIANVNNSLRGSSSRSGGAATIKETSTTSKIATTATTEGTDASSAAGRSGTFTLGSRKLDIDLTTVDFHILQSGNGLLGTIGTIKSDKSKTKGIRSPENKFGLLSKKD